MNAVKRYLRSILFSEELTVNARVNNVVFLDLCLSAFLAMILRIVLRDSPVVIAAAFLIALAAGVLLWVSNACRVHTQAGIIAVILFCDIMFPLMYFLMGGVRSAMAAYFLVAMVMVFLLTHGKSLYFFLFLFIAISTGCYVAEYFFPSLVISGMSRLEQFSDSIQAFIVVGACIAGFVVFQNRVYNEEKLKRDTEEQQIIRQDELLRVINEVSQVILTSDARNAPETVTRALKLLGECEGLDRINVWKNYLEGGIFGCRTLFSWAPQKSKGLGTLSFVYDSSLPEWRDRVFKGKALGGPIKDFSPAFRETLGQNGVVSVLVLPVFFQGFFWGFVSLDDCERERRFSETEQGILNTAALLVANAARRSEIDAEIFAADERVRLMLESSPLVCNFWDERRKSIASNEKNRELFGLSDKREYLDKFLAISPEFQPSGESSAAMAKRINAEAFVSGRYRFEWMHRAPDGSPLPVEVSIFRIKRGNTYNFLGYTRDLRESKKMMSAIQTKGEILSAVNAVSGILLNSRVDTFETDLRESMKILVGVLGADKMNIWRNTLRDGQWYVIRTHAWTGDGAGEDTLPPELSYIDDLPTWYARLSSGKSINGPVKNFPPQVMERFIQWGITSVLVMPVFLSGDFWGIVSFSDCRRERFFSDDEEAILRSASLLITNAMVQNEMNRNLVQAREEALASSNAKSAFLAIMSHEIRTPLNAII
ncbi:MAG: GAF domain-containing protein, partial [Spirochaetaceae bacterium]|nr:GAF domain-containing protein [Spirochaetaceae bacterium]